MKIFENGECSKIVVSSSGPRPRSTKINALLPPILIFVQHAEPYDEVYKTTKRPIRTENAFLFASSDLSKSNRKLFIRILRPSNQVLEERELEPLKEIIKFCLK